MTKLKIRALALVIIVGLGGCTPSDSPTDPPTPIATTLTLTPTSASLSALGATQQLTATVLDQDGDAMAGQTMVWSSSSADTVSVSTAGLLTAIANGEATITATSGSLTGTVTATVAQVAAVVVLSDTDLTLSGVGTTETVTATAEDSGGTELVTSTVTWSSSDEGVVTVVDGLLTAVAIGAATVTAQVGTESAGVTVTVVQPQEIVACTIAGTSGDKYTRGFYLDNFPAGGFSAIEMYFSQGGQTERTLTLIARSGAYDGAILGQSAPLTFTPPELGSPNLAGRFQFTAIPVTPGALVTFELVLEPGVNTSVYYDVGLPSNCPVVQTNGTAPPLDSVRRTGIGITIFR